jgi:hypothetical protein
MYMYIFYVYIFVYVYFLCVYVYVNVCVCRHTHTHVCICERKLSVSLIPSLSTSQHTTFSLTLVSLSRLYILWCFTQLLYILQCTSSSKLGEISLVCTEERDSAECAEAGWNITSMFASMQCDSVKHNWACWRMLTYADVCWRMLHTSAYVSILKAQHVVPWECHWRMLTYADVCWRMLTYADVCWRQHSLSRVSLTCMRP